MQAKLQDAHSKAQIFQNTADVQQAAPCLKRKFLREKMRRIASSGARCLVRSSRLQCAGLCVRRSASTQLQFARRSFRLVAAF